VLIVADGLGRRETMQQYFAEYGFKPAIVADWAEFVRGDASPALAVGPPHAGFVWPEGGVALVTEAELYADVARTPARRDARRTNVEAMLRDLSECASATVVHSSTASVATSTHDARSRRRADRFLHLLYANDAKLYVGCESPRHQPLQRRRSQTARCTSSAAGNGTRRSAGGAARARYRGRAFEPLRDAPRARPCFPVRCPRLEPSPLVSVRGNGRSGGSVEAVIKDLVTGKPMDRLVCGDVGFGKTEVRSAPRSLPGR
jgi:transcription-repair coupling factor (superfamily II helicase)